MGKKYFPLHVHSHYSLLDGLSKPEDIANRCQEIGVEGSAITDHGSISSHVDFLKKMNKANLKSLLGCELYICKDTPDVRKPSNRSLTHLPVIARNDKGWRELVQIVSESNRKEHFYHNPRLDLNTIGSIGGHGNIMAFSGHIGSHVSNALFDAENELSSNWKQTGVRAAKELQDIFGKDNFFLEVQMFDHMNFPKQKLIADCVREISKQTGIPIVATPDAHYARPKDAIDQRILLCSQMKVTIKQARQPNFPLSGFFKSSQYHIPSCEDMQKWHTEEELDNTLLFASRIEKYEKILRQPVLPNFQCPDGMEADEYLRHLCREGWRQKIARDVPRNKHEEYGNRVKKELEVLQGAGLSPYFLIVSDVLKYVRNKGWLPGPARGSAAGSLVSYLAGITEIDPMRYGLIFERFYNEGRNVGDHISMPDIDVDVPKYARDNVIDYLRTKYGEENVGQMITFTTMKGRGAIKDVLRAYGGMTFEEMNKVTKNIIEDHKISDELQKMKEERGEAKIIQWCLENTPKKLDEWCKIDDNGKLAGPLAERFAMAMRLEGTKTVQSKHAAGVVIAPEPLWKMCPMLIDKESGHQIAGFEMEDLEAVGGLKLDILGITGLDRTMGVQQDLATGEIHEIQ